MPAPVVEVSPNTARVSVRLLAPFVAASDALAVPVDVGLERLGLSRKALEDPDLRVSHSVAQQLLSGAVLTSGQRDLGLLAAELALPAHLDVVEYVARAQPTAGKALESAARYHALLHDGLAIDMRREGDHLILRVDFGVLPIDEAAYEFTLAVYVMAMRRVLGLATFAPLEVRFVHARPKDLTRHERVFACPIVFGAAENAIVLPLDHADIPLAGADSGLAAMLDRHAQAALQKLGRTQSLIERVREHVGREIASGSLGADIVSKRMAMSARTLHRKLTDANTSYRAVVDEVRKELALRYLEDKTLAVREVGHLLGFTTSPSFHRAFRRWTGTTPAEYRASHRKNE
ncbi:MAG TPA: AraC family transcriptional regulator ligand-binding domain-containing protein [Polyangiales bacterium]|nr:AraC family transcriptional regulator ligand-binding domain-containing protein [Polyangiales bacterium]